MLRRAAGAVLVALGLSGTPAVGEPYPVKPIRLVVDFQPGASGKIA